MTHSRGVLMGEAAGTEWDVLLRRTEAGAWSGLPSEAVAVFRAHGWDVAAASPLRCDGLSPVLSVAQPRA